MAVRADVENKQPAGNIAFRFEHDLLAKFHPISTANADADAAFGCPQERFKLAQRLGKLGLAQRICSGSSSSGGAPLSGPVWLWIQPA